MQGQTSKPLVENQRLKDHFQDEQERLAITRTMFNRSADMYNRLEWWTGLGSGPWYRLQVLERAGLKPGMKVLDVATGTGLVAKEALKLIGPNGQLTGLDPSPGMLAEARKIGGIETIEGYAEAIPLPANQFDFLSMGYALRHVGSLDKTFQEFMRVLKPGGTVCILEIVKPENWFLRQLLKFYLRYLVPTITRLLLRRRDSADLWKYYWDTIEACVPPQSIENAIKAAGFTSVRSEIQMGMFREYFGTKP